ncbi:hypothetical protein RHMOL_Rhmol13G0182000 [Rhododendron molle]|uniref:Uncharacterized protein n=1 Tax=Rhododendron molle TaxID=49168 RepID=A0ACC0L8G8_RHOML|nr:hypothetical protein RHMOL_Rhmol13G0182000 [Rhododendron molle]
MFSKFYSKDQCYTSLACSLHISLRPTNAGSIIRLVSSCILISNLLKSNQCTAIYVLFCLRRLVGSFAENCCSVLSGHLPDLIQ